MTQILQNWSQDNVMSEPVPILIKFRPESVKIELADDGRPATRTPDEFKRPRTDPFRVGFTLFMV